MGDLVKVLKLFDAEEMIYGLGFYTAEWNG